MGLRGTFNGVCISIITFISTTNILKHQAFQEGGQVSDKEIFATTMYTCIIWTINFQIAFSLSYFTWLHHLWIWSSASFCIFFCLWLYKPTFSTTPYKFLVEARTLCPMYWFITLLGISSLVPYFSCSSIQRRFFSLYHRIIQWVRHQRKDKDLKWNAMLQAPHTRTIILLS